MVTLLIIADDFTGALDTGVKFAARGAAVRVVTDYEYEFGQTDSATQVLVMDAETRHLSSEEAYDRVYQIVKRAREAGVTYIYKKTDSALRGNIGSELAAALDASGEPVLHFFPAFPKMGRTTCGGIHYIDGVPVQESVFGQDPFEPVRCSFIPDIIRQQSATKVKVVSDRTIVNGRMADEALPGEPAAKSGQAHQPVIAVYDAQTDAELRDMAGQLLQTVGQSVIAGCAGMAEALPEFCGLIGKVPAIPQFVPKFLVACGSVNPITGAQLDYAERQGFKRIRLTPQQKLDREYFKTDMGQAKLREVAEQCRNTCCCILDTNDAADEPDTLEYAAEKGIALEQVRVQIAETLGYLVKELVKGGVRSTMLITGGDSLLGFMNQIEVCEMTPICEMAPGTVLSQFEIDGRTYEVISKSGGFGAEDLMVKLAEKILNKKEEIALC